MNTLDPSFFESLHQHLTNAIGPVSEIILDEAVEDLGYDLLYFPSNEAGDLIDFISREIPRQARKRQFVETMTAILEERRRNTVS